MRLVRALSDFLLDSVTKHAGLLLNEHKTGVSVGASAPTTDYHSDVYSVLLYNTFVDRVLLSNAIYAVICVRAISTVCDSAICTTRGNV